MDIYGKYNPAALHRNGKIDEHTSDAPQTRDDVSSKIKTTATSFRNTANDNIKDYGQKIVTKSYERLDDKKSNGVANNGYVDGTDVSTNKRNEKINTTTAQDNNLGSKSRYPVESVSQRNYKDSTKEDKPGYRPKDRGDQEKNSKVDETHDGKSSKPNKTDSQNKQAMDSKEDLRNGRKTLNEDFKNTSAYNSFENGLNKDKFNYNGLKAAQTSRDSHGNNMGETHPQSTKQNGYHSNNDNFKKQTQSQYYEHDSKSNYAETSSKYDANSIKYKGTEINNSKGPGASNSDGKEKRNSAYQDDVSNTNKTYNSNKSHETANTSRQVDQKNTTKISKSSTGPYDIDTEKKSTPAQSEKGTHNNSNSKNNNNNRNTNNDKTGKANFSYEETDGKMDTKGRHELEYNSGERGRGMSKDRLRNEDDLKRQEYIRSHYSGRYSDHEEDNNDKIVDKDAERYKRGRASSFSDFQEEGDEDVDDYSDREMLDQSSAELKVTIDELERRYDTIENEGNEWKTRFETQTEMNQQLEKQILLLQEKVEEAKRNLKEAGKSPRDNRAFDDLADASPQMVKSLERERNSLFSQLRDLEWRLDQESKAYHKANDERKHYVLEINATKVNIGDLRSKQRQTLLAAQEAPPRITARSNPGDSPRTYRDTGGNIPEDQRIIDPRYGPIRKTAGIKALPSLD